MKLAFEGDAGRFELEVSRKGAQLSAARGELKGAWEILAEEGAAIQLASGAQRLNAFAYREKDDFFVHVNGRTYRLKNITEELSRSGDSHTADLKVVAPMPGTVIKLLVEQGATVKRNDPLVIVEAMKMENEVRAPGDAVVVRILVANGEKVGFGQPLLELAPPEASGADGAAPGN